MKFTPKLILIIITIISLHSSTSAQTSFNLKGQIIDATRDEPLIAAAVSIKGKPVGTATDFDGKFSFNIAQEYWKDTLVVSMLGYKAYKLPVSEAKKLPNQYLQTELEETAFELVMAEVGAPIILNNIFFQFNEHNLLPSSFTELEKLYNFLKKNDKVVIEIAGHTDSIGTDIYNAALSEARASSVVAYLEEKGITQTRMTAKGYGESQPVVSNSTEKGQAINRRVTFTVLSKGEIVNQSQMPDTTSIVIDTVQKQVIVEVPTLDSNTKPVLKPTLEVPTIDGNTSTDEPIVDSNIKIENTDKGNISQKSVDELIANYGINKGFNGTIAVAHNDKVIHKSGLGFSDLANTKPNTLKTKFYIGQQTEQYIAVLILKLVKKNQLNLSVPIENYINDIPKSISDKININQLLSHTSGICNNEFNKLADLELCYLPNKFQEYSNANYIILGKILENIYNDNIADIIEKEILKPFSLYDTKVVEPLYKDKHIATGYRKEGGRIEQVMAQNQQNEIAINGIISTVEDIVKFQKALKNPNFLSNDLQILMESPNYGNQTFSGKLMNVVLDDKVLQLLISETINNGHKTLIAKTLSGNTIIVINTNIETDNLAPIYRDILKKLYLSE